MHLNYISIAFELHLNCTARPEINLFRSFKSFLRTHKKRVFGSPTLFLVQTLFSPFRSGRTHKKRVGSEKGLWFRKRFPGSKRAFWRQNVVFLLIFAPFGHQNTFYRSKTFLVQTLFRSDPAGLTKKILNRKKEF